MKEKKPRKKIENTKAAPKESASGMREFAQAVTSVEPTGQLALLADPTPDFWEWVEPHVDPEELEGLQESNGGSTCILVPDRGGEEQFEEYVMDRAHFLLVALFSSWVEDHKLWPACETFEDLEKYFDFSIVPMVVNLELPLN